MILFPPFKGFVRTFILVCVAAFVLSEFARLGTFGTSSYQFFINFFGLTPRLVFSGMIYQLVTWVFVHGNFTHLLFNAFAFWMFGSLIEELWGTKKFVWFVFAASIATGLLVCLWGLLIDPATYLAPTIGASGVIFAILMAVSRIYPDQMILVFFFFPMKMRYFAWLMIAIEFYALYNSNQQGISNVAHLGGAFVGFAYISVFGKGGGRGRYSGGGSGTRPGWIKSLKEKLHQRRMRKRIRVIRVSSQNESTRIH